MSISTVARRVARLLKATGRKVVFAESCTGGLVSGSLTMVAGISEHHCGGVVVYRDNTKVAYLGIPRNLLVNPGSVSQHVAVLMAQCVLEKTPEADIAASVTGHLGPNAPAKLNGLVFVVVATRKPAVVTACELRCRRSDSRVVRQRWVVEKVLEFLAQELDSSHGSAGASPSRPTAQP